MLLRAKDWLAEFQTVRMEKNYKMVTLEVPQETDSLARGLPLADLTEKWRFLRRSPELLKDLRGVQATLYVSTVAPPPQWLV